MDALDSKILRALQRDSDRPVAELADEIGLSPSACHRRIKLLEEAGIIAGYRAELDRAALGLTAQVFVEITLTTQSEDALAAFESAVGRFPDIVECHLTSGSADYLLRVVARDLADFEAIHRNCLSRLPNVGSMRSSFTLRTVQDWRGIRVP